uniref:Putative terminase n=1 Tax=viral metagenome TaxID=1070528 RepID=A0A6M3IHB3_9ZZZZ
MALTADRFESGEHYGEYYHPVTDEPLKIRRKFSYKALPTIRKFHKERAEIRAIIGPVGSGKTAAVSVEIGYRIPMMYWNRFGLNKTRWIILRNTYPMLIDSTQRTFFEWFPPILYGKYNKVEKFYSLSYTTLDFNGKSVRIEVEIMFRSCDRPEEVDKFRGYEITGYYVDEADEVNDDIKKVLKQRIGRYPSMNEWAVALRRKNMRLRNKSLKYIGEVMERNPKRYQTAFGIETSNPPSTESSIYWSFAWQTYVPGPKPEKAPLNGHVGFWQPERENEHNLRPGYYDRMAEAYYYAKDWIDRYIKGKPGIRLKGKAVYNNFSRQIHEAKANLIWGGDTLYRGWDNTGLHPACVIVQMPVPGQIQVLKEFWTERENIVTFAKRIVANCNKLFINAVYVDFADPAGWNQHSQKDGSLTSNSLLMEEECGIILEKSEQNFSARVNVVDNLMRMLVQGGEPALLVDPDCIGTINGFMGGYYYPRVASIPGEEVYSELPVKNKYSDVHDALQYVIIKLIGNFSTYSNQPSKGTDRPFDPLIAT